MASSLKTLLDRLTEKGEAAIQVTFTNGAVIAGAVKRVADIDGLYVLRTMVGNPQTKKMQPIDYHFEIDAVYAVAVPIETLIEPATSPILPGRLQ